jgi:glycosyltransferase involved in cell wall biosynthesis
MTKIIIYHPVMLPVLHYGGTERVVMWLAQTLHNMGHKVAVFAAPGSKMPEGIECITDRGELLRRAPEFDVLHGATRPDDEIIKAIQGRVLVTIHGNGKPGEKFHPNTVFISRNHARRHGASVFVYNGIDISELIISKNERPNRFLFLSKTSWRVKNLKGAVRFLSKFKQNFWIAGGDRPYWIRVFVWIKKLMGQDWKWVGSVDQKSKAEFLLAGKAMVFPILWNEPFGLVVIEALACGTPVLANPHGSLAELLEFAPQCLMKNEQDWKEALTGARKFPTPEECRAWVEAHFTQEKMAENYLKLYELVKAGKPLHDHELETLVGAEDISGVIA